MDIIETVDPILWDRLINRTIYVSVPKELKIYIYLLEYNCKQKSELKLLCEEGANNSLSSVNNQTLAVL